MENEAKQTVINDLMKFINEMAGMFDPMRLNNRKCACLGYVLGVTTAGVISVDESYEFNSLTSSVFDKQIKVLIGERYENLN